MSGWGGSRLGSTFVSYGDRRRYGAIRSCDMVSVSLSATPFSSVRNSSKAALKLKPRDLRPNHPQDPFRIRHDLHHPGVVILRNSLFTIHCPVLHPHELKHRPVLPKLLRTSARGKFPLAVSLTCCLASLPRRWSIARMNGVSLTSVSSMVVAHCTTQPSSSGWYSRRSIWPGVSPRKSSSPVAFWDWANWRRNFWRASSPDRVMVFCEVAGAR